MPAAPIDSSCLRRAAWTLRHDKQRETAAERAKKGPSARRYTQQPVRHWDHWLHENVDLANTHVIAYSADGTNRVDLTPVAQREFAIEPQFDVSADGTRWLSRGRPQGPTG